MFVKFKKGLRWVWKHSTPITLTVLFVFVSYWAVTLEHEDPFDYHTFPQPEAAQITLDKVTAERVEFYVGLLKFYIQGNSPSLGEGTTALLFSKAGHSCIQALQEKDDQKFMTKFSKDSDTCFGELFDSERAQTITRQMADQNEGPDMFLPVWSAH